MRVRVSYEMVVVMLLTAVLAAPVLSFAQTAAPLPSPDPRDERDKALNLAEPISQR